MGSKKTSTKRKKSSRKLVEHNIWTENLKNPKLVKEVLIRALMENDLESFQDALLGFLRSTSKSKLSLKTGLGRRTLYDLIDESKEFNPTLSTLGAILEAIAA